MTTTRAMANRVRTVLAWIDDNADTLPDGWHLDVGPSEAELRWYPAIDKRTVRDVLAPLEATFGPGANDALGASAWTEWPPEGDRPGMAVFTRSAGETS